MKLYYSPGACSLADHIALTEAGLRYELERVDLKRKMTASGVDFNTINPKGYVPALLLDDGELITENIAVLDWIATQSHSVSLDGPISRTRLLEVLAYISTEIHKTFHPLFSGGSDSEKGKARSVLDQRLGLLAGRMRGDYLFGRRPTVADFYLFVMLLWTEKLGIAVPVALASLRERLKSRPGVQAAMHAEE